jgi:ABC-2 type transport system permease protein
MIALNFTSTSLRRIVRDRTALFFLIVLPILVILVVGLAVRGFDKFRVGVVDEGAGAGQRPLATELVAQLRVAPSLKLIGIGSRDAAAIAVRRGEVAATVIIPADLDAVVSSGGTASITVIGDDAAGNTRAARTAIEAVVAEHAARLNAARFVVTIGAADFAQGLAAATTAQALPPALAVRDEVVNAGRAALPSGYSSSAPTMLVLFVFINSLAFGGALIESRRLGIHQRASASPATARTIAAGETLTYLTIAVGQALLIVFVGAVALGVHWGNVWAASALIAVWALVGTSAGLLSGTLFRTAEQATAIGPALGMGLGMLGGCMWPLEIVGKTMRTIGHLTPHAWAVDAWTKVVGSGAGLNEIARPLLVLALWAAALITVATTRLRHVLEGRS